MAIPIYLLGNLGAFLVLISTRGDSDNYQVQFHAAQSMLFYLILSLLSVILSSLGLNTLLFNDILMFVRIAFIVFGSFYLITNRDFRIPYLADIASKLIY